MDTFKSFSFVLHVLRPSTDTGQRCDLCKGPIVPNSVIVVSNGHEDLSWFVKAAHLDCLKGIISAAYTPLLNQEVHVTPKVTRDGGKVDVFVGANVFTFSLENAANLGVSIFLASVSSGFDNWAYQTLSRDGFDAIPVLVRLRTIRGAKVISDASVLGNVNFLLADCWQMFVEACSKELGIKEDAHLMIEWEKEFRRHFGIENQRESIQ